MLREIASRVVLVADGMMDHRYGRVTLAVSEEEPRGVHVAAYLDEQQKFSSFPVPPNVEAVIQMLILHGFCRRGSTTWYMGNTPSDERSYFDRGEYVESMNILLQCLRHPEVQPDVVLGPVQESTPPNR